MFLQFATLYVIHHEVDSVGLLKDVVHSDDERVVNLVQNDFLTLNVIDCVVFENDILPYALHGIVHVSLLAVDKVDFSKSALTYYLDHFKVFERRCVCLATSVEKR